ncbi:hypothetical protein K4K54_011428 [Colletotrichum sp. SAR 10_86]|nr:hypothetical protein K4K52_008216 [Colletotrichum sp. SAR 10_76]KAI8237721.1 hypothetical protein K4K54_011428 [Colletotrichum sp. SAR 10_86]
MDSDFTFNTAYATPSPPPEFSPVPSEQFDFAPSPSSVTTSPSSPPKELEVDSWGPSDLHQMGYLDVAGNWRCRYAGCCSSRVFLRACDLRKHFRGHAKYFFCTEKRCQQAGVGFATRKDFQRHMGSHKPAVRCLHPDCDRIFSRKDNMSIRKTKMPNANVTIVGVGNIGAAMVSTWLDSGLKVAMWNRNIDRPKIAKLVERGAMLEPNLNEAIRCSDTIVLCVSTYDNIDEVLSPILPLKGTERSITVINITTGTSEQARQMETRLKSNGIAKYFDGAIMVTPELIGTIHSSMFFSGENEAEFERISGILRPLGSSHYVAQDSGAASLWDIAALAAMYGIYSGAIVALNVLKRQRPDDAAAESPSTEVPMKKIVLPLLSTLLPHLVNLSRALDKEDWNENFGNPASMQLKGLQTILTTLREEKVNAYGLELFYRMMQRVVQDKGEDAGLAVMGTYLLE